MTRYTGRDQDSPYWGRTRRLMRRSSRRTLRRTSGSSVEVSYRMYAEKKHKEAIRQIKLRRRLRTIITLWLLFIIIVAIILSVLF